MKLEIIHDDSLDNLQVKVNSFLIKEQLHKKHIIQSNFEDIGNVDLIRPRYIYTILFEK